MANISDNIIGFSRDEVITPSAAIKRRFRTGTTVRGDDGGVYQYAKANATISADTSAANITLSSGEYVAAASGGSAVSPGVDMASGDYGWFKIG